MIGSMKASVNMRFNCKDSVNVAKVFRRRSDLASEGSSTQMAYRVLLENAAPKWAINSAIYGRC